MFALALMLAAQAPADTAKAHTDPVNASAEQVIADPKAANDPMICRREKVIGSLLQSKKTCMRKSEWAAQRELDRQAIERAQVQGDRGSPAG